MDAHTAQSSSKPLYILGPCSVENRDQMLDTARGLKQHIPYPFLLRGGLWKPRTRPGAFEGLGEQGINYLSEAAEEIGVDPITEVARASHVATCLRAGFRHLWIGARTTVNPFLIDELAEALRGTEVTIFIKNPVNRDVGLWLGAVERLERAGCSSLFAIHRGFSAINNTAYRNPPYWQLSLEFQRQRPDIPMMGDPSHMGGRRDLLDELSQQMGQLGYRGLMIESHIEPNLALTDAAQQVTPRHLASILQQVQWSELHPKEGYSDSYINNQRRAIDTLDKEILHLIQERMNIAHDIGVYKQEENLAIYQPERWENTLTLALKRGHQLGLSKAFIMELFQSLHAESIQHQFIKKDKQ